MQKLRVGVVGLNMGVNHLKGYQTHSGAEIVAVADTDPVRLEKVGDEFGVPNRYLVASEMIAREKLDVLSICIPNKFHKPLTIEALHAGCHVLCEKPMALNAAEARDMEAEAQKTGRRLMINFTSRFTDQISAMKKQVEAGVFGDIYFGRTIWRRRRGIPGFGGWFGTKALSGGGPLIDLGVHRLDLALWLMGYPKPVWVLGATYDAIAQELAAREGKTFDVEDFAAATITFENGATLLLEASWAGNQKERNRIELELLGSKGGLLQHNVDGGYELESEHYVERDGAQFDLKFDLPATKTETSMHHFVNAILNNEPNMATAKEGRIIMEILDGIYESARIHAPVRLQNEEKT